MADPVQSSPDTSELLPCPFCGCDKIDVFYDHPDSVGEHLAGHYIHHPVWKTYPDSWKCRQNFGGKFDSKEAATRAWNTRATQPTRSSAVTEGDAVAWIALSNDQDKVRIWWRDKERADEWARTHNAPIIPLYAHPLCVDAILPLRSPDPAQPSRVTGCVNQVEEAACLIWAELCPGMVMGDADLPHYEAAARAVLALSSTERWTEQELAEAKAEAKELSDYFNTWPNGCHDPDSCARHLGCMYVQCSRHNKDGNEVAKEINDRLLSLPQRSPQASEEAHD